MASSSAVITLKYPTRKHDSLPLLLRPLLFAPVAVSLARALQAAGVERFLLLTEPDLADAAAACFPEGTQVCFLNDPALSDALRFFAAGEPEDVISINQPVWMSFSGAEILAQADSIPAGDRGETGIFRLNARKLATNGSLGTLRQGRELAQELEGLPMAIPLEDDYDLVDVRELARTEQIAHLMEDGVRFVDPNTVYLDPSVTIGAGTVLLPNVILRGNVVIGANCEIGPNTMIRDCTLGDGCVVNSSQLNEAEFGANVNIGPFAYVRPGTRVADNCKVGDFVEVKNAVIGEGTKLPHLIYVGDSDVGARCNFGCGSITCNYDGNRKYRTTVGDDVFIGCNTNLVAPVTVESGAFTAAGSTITDTVPADALAIARARQELRAGWAKRHREKR